MLYRYGQLCCPFSISKDIAEDFETSFDTPNIELHRLLLKQKNKKVIGLMKDELGGQTIKEFVGLRAKIYSYLKDNNDEDKKEKGTKKCFIKRKLKFQLKKLFRKKNCLEPAQIEKKINHLGKTKIDVDGLKEDHEEFIKTID